MSALCRTRRLLAASGLLILPLAAGAQDEGPGKMTTDRPDQTESSSIVPPGFVQLETGWTYAEDGDGAARLESHSVPGSLVRIGVARNLEARIGFGGWMRAESGAGSQTTSDTGFGDLDVGAKYGLFDGTGAQPDVAFLFAVTLPTGDEAFSADRALPAMRAIFAHELSNQVSLGYNVGVVWGSVAEAGGGTASVADLIYTVSFAFDLGHGIGAFAESFGTLSVDDRTASGHSLDAGFTFVVSENFQLDLASGVGLNDAAEDWFLGAGLAVRIPR